ncbi:hypothetical protein C440_05682 [Haloferax mucosum ATCC BAA-1512]|uniref:Uncharacterized protein n=1 Tax=Haloferax mucosum ATCC BAA-1512 TaxID=662479 RepID=M0IH36_9EURY|nr:phage tail tube protein [Haloferax mucosum]ELZ96056.1 hypothetical protein C440_05682 [Haloferax mucosum ATCC BAA-1512]
MSAGAGSSTVAFTPEPSFGADPDMETATFNLPFKNPTIGEASLSNELRRIRDPDSVVSVASLAQNFQGALNISGELSTNNWHQLVFNNDANDGFEPGRMPSSRWYLGVDYLTDQAIATSERELAMCIVTDAQITYQQGGAVTLDLTMIYGDEKLSSSITPSNIQKPTDSEIVAFHGFDVQIDGVSIDKLQNATLSLSPSARFHRGTSRHPVDAVIGDVTPTLSTTGIYSGPGAVERAFGDTGATTPADRLTAVNGTVSTTNGSGTTTSYNLTGLKPQSYNWQDLVAPDTDLTDPVTYNVSNVTVS